MNSFIECPKCGSRSMHVFISDAETEKYAGFVVITCPSLKCPFRIRVPIDRSALQKITRTVLLTT